MYAKGYLLKTDIEFDNAMHFRLIVSITEGGQSYGCSCIKTHNPEQVTMVNGRQFNKNCEFMVVSYASFYEPTAR